MGDLETVAVVLIVAVLAVLPAVLLRRFLLDRGVSLFMSNGAAGLLWALAMTVIVVRLG